MLGNDAMEQIGRLVGGRYKLVGLLGTGAMGAVYSAEDRDRSEPRAIKVLHKYLSASKEAEARFRREAFVGEKLIHPNCVGVLDSGATDDGSFFLVMELLEGESLGDLLAREGPLAWQRALRITRHVLRGLEHAHRASVVHRDIKPDNLFVTRRADGSEFTRILDFGIAKLIGSSAQNALTQAGIAIGTPKYLSPEQAVGQDLDGRCDLYSTSVVLYEMLTGRTPFGDREPLKTLMAHVSEPVPTFAQIAPKLAVPPEVELLVRDGLAKMPADRIASAGDYIARIDRLIGPEPRPRTQKRRSLAVVAGLAVAAVVAIGVVVGVSFGGGGDKAAASAATTDAAPANRAEVDAALDMLEHGKTCAIRRSAVAQLRAFGDPRALPALEKARARPRRGKSSNACLQDDADAAIAALHDTRAH
jgi:serine/threonine-protein kinase